MWLALSWPGDRTVLYGSLEQPNPAYWILSVHTKDPCNHNLWSTRETLSYFPVLRAFLGVSRWAVATAQGLDSIKTLLSRLSPLTVSWTVGLCVFLPEGGAEIHSNTEQGGKQWTGCTLAEFTQNTPLWHLPAGLCWGIGLFMFAFEYNHSETTENINILFLSLTTFISALLPVFINSLACLTTGTLSV